MARTHQRSIRFEDEHKPLLDSLPEGTVNTFINELVRIAKNEPAVLNQVILSDERFNDWKLPEQAPNETVDKMVKAESKTPRKSALPVKKPTGPIEITQQGPITETQEDFLVGAEEVAEIPAPDQKAKERAEIAAATGEPEVQESKPEPDTVSQSADSDTQIPETHTSDTPVDGAAEFDRHILGKEPEPAKTVEKPVETVQKPEPAPAAKSVLGDLFPGL